MLELAKTAAREALSSRAEFMQEEFDRRYHDVKLLMKNYRKLKTYYENVEPEALEVGAICQMRHKTGLMMNHVEKMLTAYKALCEKANTPEESRRWEVLNLRYMAQMKMSLSEISFVEVVCAENSRKGF